MLNLGLEKMSGESQSNWTAVTPSAFPWEKDAIDFIRASFPTHEPYRAWSNFEFSADDGSINEVDLLVFTKLGFFLVEIKSHPGVLSGDAHTWKWQHEGRTRVIDSPLYLANLKAKKLSSLLQRQRAFDKLRVPFIEPLIFCSAENLRCELEGNARFHVCLRDKSGSVGIMAALKSRECPGLAKVPRGDFDRPTVKAVSRALEQIGIKPSQRSRRVGDYELQGLIDEGPGYQDFLGKHVTLADTLRRIRIYPTLAASAEQRTTIQRAAEREFNLLQTLEHRGVLRAMDFTKHELGPAIIFQHIPTAIRLDHFLVQYKDKISNDTRLSLMRQIAETIDFAHGKHVVHRNLSPRNILVVQPDSANPKTVIMNWQLGYRQAEEGETFISKEVTATIHMDQFVEEPSKVFMAPETFTDLDSLGEHHDIFSLGAVCYQLFTGQAPADSPVALAEKLRVNRGLLVSSVLNGAPESLEELVRYSTDPDVNERLEPAAKFFEYLDNIEEELTTPDNQHRGDPTQAKPGDKLAGGYIVERKLGTGSTATAILVSKDNRSYVLKIAVDTDHNDRVKDEGEVLRKLNSPLIVRYHGTLQIEDRTAILLDQAGTKTLRKRLTEEGRLSLDLLERFGEDLLQAVVLLEREGIAHRDIKPDNIGVDFSGSGGALHLVLFDFSLSRCSRDNVRAGTPGYLDPFLPLRKPPRWDLQAERYAAAVTLYQMATGFLPVWHDGKTDPTMVECEATIDAERFDANLRDEFSEFFRRALRRNPKERFDNAHQMLESWQKLFQTNAPKTTTTTDGIEIDNSALLAAATKETNIAELGLGPAAVDALDRLNVVKVEDLLNIGGRRLARMRGVGNKTRKRILAAVKVLRDRLGSSTLGESSSVSTDGTDTYEGQIPKEKLSLDAIFQRIVRAKAKSRNATESVALEALLGLDPRIDDVWPSQSDVAPHVGVTRGRISQILAEALGRWIKDSTITALRDQIAVMLALNAGVMSADELCESLLTARGSLEDEPRRSRLGRAVTRAAVETENLREEPKFILRRADANALIAIDMSLADYAAALGQRADEMAAEDPLVPPARVIEMLREVPLPPEAEPMSDARLVRLAAAASQGAALSSRQEIYPRNMDAGRAIKLSHGGLVGVASLTPDQIRQRITSRYPLAAPLPPRPELDKLLVDAGLQLVWDPDRAGGAYVSTARSVLSVTDSSGTPHRYSTLLRSSAATPTPHVNPAFVPPEVAEAQQFEDRLLYAQKHGSFLALTVPIKLYDRAREELAARFAGRQVDLESVFVDALKQSAHEVGADWQIVVDADAAAPNTADWRNLNQLIASKVIPKVEAALLSGDTTQTTLAYNLDWLARYGQVVMLPRIQQAVLNGKIHGVWFLMPASTQTPMPFLDGTAVPVTSSNQWAAIPESWCQNVHRSTASRREVTP